MRYRPAKYYANDIGGIVTNPWAEFKASNYMVHESDRDVVESHNAKHSSKPEYQFQTWMPPEPWIGSLEAPVVILYANPGATDDDLAGKRQADDALIREYSIANLNQTLEDFPHFFFDPLLENTAGGRWFRARFSNLINETSLQAVSQGIITVELAPYHSRNWRNPSKPLPTQEFTNSIVRNAVSKGSLIVGARGRKLWEAAVPELRNYPRIVRPRSQQSAHVSPGNYGDGFQKLVTELS